MRLSTIRTLRLLLCLIGVMLLAAPESFRPAAAQDNGLAVKRPIVAGACIDCPWESWATS